MMSKKDIEEYHNIEKNMKKKNKNKKGRGKPKPRPRR
tara:strand:- start:17229 stop:17339 length:111 start_codon:yes stop_codon:yes gene_type:complete